MWRIWWAPNNASKRQMGFNSAFKELKNNIIFKLQSELKLSLSDLSVGRQESQQLLQVFFFVFSISHVKNRMIN
jgi:hypothetical protein